MSRIIFNFFEFLFFSVSRWRAKLQFEVFKNRANYNSLITNDLRAPGAPKSLRLRGLYYQQFIASACLSA